MGIKEEVINLKQQGYNETQIKGYLTKKGYSIDSINQEFSHTQPQEPQKNNHKLFLIILIILIVIVLLNIAYYFYNSTEHYSNNPEKWLDESGNSRIIDVEEANEDQGYVDNAGEQQNNELDTMFSNEGWYKGNYFQKWYEENGRITMRITNNMTPEDRVIEGYMIERLEKEDLYAYIFLDSDWKNSLPNTKVYWGKNYQNNLSFDFSNEVSEGIYMMKLKDDMNRFYANYSIHTGGFYIGEINQDSTGTLMSFS